MYRGGAAWRSQSGFDLATPNQAGNTVSTPV